jgi:capsular exopolysaccharide synthesis family protein
MARLQRKRLAREEQVTGDPSGQLATVTSPLNAASEAYRTLRTNLLYTLLDTPPKVIVVTSPGPMEGKSTTCANLGVVLAQAGKSTLILDCDFRQPAIHKIFGLRNLLGVANVLVGERSPQEIWHEPLPGLKVGIAGSIPPLPAELFGTNRFADLLGQVRQEFDYVLVDAPPTNLVSDSAILAAQGDGVVLVIDSQKTRRGSVRQAMRGLEAVGAHVLGTVMNNAKVSESNYSTAANLYE